MMRAQEGAFLQRKLTVNEPGDAFEQEADRVSEQVMRTGEPGASPAAQSDAARGQGHARVQLKAEAAGGAADTREAPPIVDEVLRSPGQPLDAGTRAFMEPRFGHDFSGVRVHSDAKAAESAQAIGAEAYASGSHIALPRSASFLGTQEGARLMAHELTHVIQQSNGDKAGVSAPTASGAGPVVALKPKPGESKFVGMRLGKSGSGEDVRVIKGIGSPEGYDDRLQAMAVARLWKAEYAAVVQGLAGDDKWYALEVSAPLSDNTADTPTRAVYPVRPLSSISDEQKKDYAIRQRWDEIHHPKDPDSVDPRQQKEKEAELTKDWAKANVARASAILGIPESEIELHESSGDAAAGKVNIIEKPPQNQGNARTGPVGAVGAGSAGAQYAIQVDFDTLFNPGEAQAAFFHETIHLQDFRVAQMWADQYRKEKNSSFDPGDAAAFDRFQDWINTKRGQGKISKPDAEIVKQLVGRGKNYSGAGTEVRANLRTFLELLRAGQPALAAKKLSDYAVALLTGSIETPEEKSPVRQELAQELSAAYQEMSETMKDQYDTAVAAALKENPKAWIIDLDFSKTRKAKGAAK